MMGAVRMTNLAAAFAVLCFSAVMAAAQDDANVIEIGTMYNTSGQIGPLGRPSEKGAALAIEKINGNGGILGREVVQKDVQTNSVLNDIHEASDDLVSANPDMVGVVGFVDSGSVLAAAPAVVDANMVFVTSGATSPKLPAEVPDYLYLACFGDNVQAAAAAQWAYEEKQARYVTVYVETDKLYPRLLQGYFRTSFEQYGGVVRSVHAIDPGDTASPVPAPEASDVVFLSVEDAKSAVAVIGKLREQGFGGPIIGGDGYDAPEIWAANPDIDNVFYTTHAYLGKSNTNPVVREFVSAYKTANSGEMPNAFAALAYDAVGLVKAAIERSGEATPAGLLKGLAGLENYDGVTGTISYKGKSSIPLKSVTIIGVDKGKLAYMGNITPRLMAKP